MYLGLDIGTGSAKALVLTKNGEVVATASAPYEVLSPRSGWAETDPLAWWKSATLAVKTAADGYRTEIEAIGLSGQMHTVVLTDKKGAPVRPAILWADTRSTESLKEYRALHSGTRHRLANPYVAGMAGPSLLWLRDHEPDNYAAARWALQPKDWLRLRLTGETAAESSDASATLLYDLHSDDWAWDVVEALHLRSDLLAPLLQSADVSGYLTASAARDLGLRPHIPVAAGAGDAAASLLGSGLIETGHTQLTVGTGGQIASPLRAPDPDPTYRTHLFRAVAPNQWYAMAAVQNVGLALEWVRQLFGISWKEIYAEAAVSPAGAEGCLFIPYLTGERTPHMDSQRRGAWVGLGLHHGRAHVLRAALEGVAFALRDGLRAMEERGITVTDVRLAGGGTLEPMWRQMLSDVLERPLLILRNAGASARGAALLGAVANGTFKDIPATLALAPTVQDTARPGPDRLVYRDVFERYREISSGDRNVRRSDQRGWFPSDR